MCIRDRSNMEFDTYDIKFADINGDGFLDVIEANSDDFNVYYINREKRK